MCGIVGYIGNQQAAPILLEGLAKLEYRGYDSAGICVYDGTGFRIAKTKGRLGELAALTHDGADDPGTVGIGHTRWATHGAPSDQNSHPHLSESGKIAVVHNGIIENEALLRRKLTAGGTVFRSETDTEVVACLIGADYEKTGDFLGAVRRTVARLQGSFALGILCVDHPDTLIAVKKDSPLIFGYGEGENFIASDVPAILKYTKTVSYLNDGEMAVVTGNSVAFYDASGAPIQKEREQILWELSAAEKGGYDHFMMKEMLEQPKALRDTVHPRIQNGRVELGDLGLDRAFLKGLRRICFVACGSAYYVSLLAKYTIEKACRLPVEAMMASEFRYCDPVIDEHCLMVVVSQSGETADTLAALREAKRRGARTLAIVNVVGSAIAKTADHTLYTWAGPEIAVATTKAFTAQLGAVYLLTLHMARELGTMEPSELDALTQELLRLPDTMEALLKEEYIGSIREAAKTRWEHHDAFFIGRNLDSVVCMEGSLKLKEIAYLHSEAYPAGELKHGPISLIENGTMVVALATIPALFDKTMVNIREVSARGADVFCVTLEGRGEDAAQMAGTVVTVPEVAPMFQPSLSLIPLQLFSYFVAVNRGCDVDKPKNLAKSVTVE